MTVIPSIISMSWGVPYTNKKTGEIQNPLIRDVIDLVESQKQEYLASQPLSDDGSSASTNLSRARVNKMVEDVIFRFLILLI